jgi:hypothetical protein
LNSKQEKNLKLFQSENKAAAEHIKSLEGIIKDSEFKEKNLLIQIENLEQYNEDLLFQCKKQNDSKNAQYKENEDSKLYKDHMNNLNSKNIILEQELNTLQLQIKDLNLKNEQILNQKSVLEAYENELHKNKIKNKDVFDLIEQLRMEIRYLKEENASIIKNNDELTKLINTYNEHEQMNLLSDDEESSYCKEMIGELQNQINSLNQQLIYLKNENDTLRENNNNNKNVQNKMTYQRENNLRQNNNVNQMATNNIHTRTYDLLNSERAGNNF